MTSCTAADNVHLENHLGTQLSGVLYTRPLIQPFQFLGIYTRGTRKIYLHTSLDTNVHKSLVDEQSKLKATQIPINRCMDKQPVLHSHTLEYHAATKNNKLQVHTA